MSTATGLGSGIVTVWFWNTFLARFLAWVVGVEHSSLEMPAEVAAAVAPAIVAIFERYMP